jgi:hypothetical protein
MVWERLKYALLQLLKHILFWLWAWPLMLIGWIIKILTGH